MVVVIAQGGVVHVYIPTTPERSRMMTRVRRKNTAPELALRAALWQAGCRYRLKTTPKLPGAPDIIFPGKRIAVFVDGCFRHACPLHASWPKTNAKFWTPKLERTRRRGEETTRRLSET